MNTQKQFKTVTTGIVGLTGAGVTTPWLEGYRSHLPCGVGGIACSIYGQNFDHLPIDA
jgi:hypothetical protein